MPRLDRSIQSFLDSPVNPGNDGLQVFKYRFNNYNRSVSLHSAFFISSTPIYWL
jgi:hypothetical protein